MTPPSDRQIREAAAELVKNPYITIPDDAEIERTDDGLGAYVNAQVWIFFDAPRYWVITGRALGDDEDVMFCTSEPQTSAVALEMFGNFIRDLSGPDAEVILTSTAMSQTPICETILRPSEQIR